MAMTNWMDMVPLLAAVAGQTGAALSEQGGNKMGVALGNLASQMGQNAAHAFPQGWSKAVGQQTSALNTPFAPAGEYSVNQSSGLTAQQAASSMANPQQQLQPMTSSGIRMSPFAAMMMSPEQQNAMARSQLEQTAQPTDIAYKKALTEQAQTQSTATKHAMSALTPWQQAEGDREQQRIDLAKKAQEAQAQGDAVKNRLYTAQADALQRQSQLELGYMAATSPEKKLEYIKNMSPEYGLKFFELNQKHDPLAKLGMDISKALAQGAADYGRSSDEIFEMITSFLGKWYGDQNKKPGTTTTNPNDPLNLGIVGP